MPYLADRYLRATFPSSTSLSKVISCTPWLAACRISEICLQGLVQMILSGGTPVLFTRSISVWWGDIQRRSSELGAGADGGNTRPALTPRFLHPVKPYWREAVVKGSSHHEMLTLRGQGSRKPMVGLRAKCPWNFAFLSCCSHCTCFFVASPLACSALLSTRGWQMWALNKWDKCDSLNYHDKKVKKNQARLT